MLKQAFGDSSSGQTQTYENGLASTDDDDLQDGCQLASHQKMLRELGI
jgi:hypothetical protein